MTSPTTESSASSPSGVVAAFPSDRFWQRFQWAVLALFVVLAYAYVWAQQPRYGPDEPRHIAYVRMLVEKHQLPVIQDGVELDGAHSQHPPLYYLLVSPVYMAAKGFGEPAVYYALKCLAPLMMLGALLFFRGALRRTFPDRPFSASVALAVVAFLPEFLLESCVANNDTLTVMLASAFLWICVRSLEKGPDAREAVYAGLILAAIANSKSTGLTLAPLWLLAVVLRARRHGGSVGLWVRDLAIGYGLLALLGSWWYLYNIQRYGQPMVFEFWGGQLQPKHPRTGEVLTPLQVYTTGEAIPLSGRALLGLFQSFWSQIDWIPVQMREPIWWTLLVLVAVAAAGYAPALFSGLMGALQKRKAGAAASAGERWVGSPLLVLGTGFLLNYGSIVYIATFVHLGFYQGGRYVMPAVFGAGALLAEGWRRWFRGEGAAPVGMAVLPRQFQVPVAVAIAAAFIAFNVLCIVELVTYLNPMYVQPWPTG